MDYRGEENHGAKNSVRSSTLILNSSNFQRVLEIDKYIFILYNTTLSLTQVLFDWMRTVQFKLIDTVSSANCQQSKDDSIANISILIAGRPPDRNIF